MTTDAAPRIPGSTYRLQFNQRFTFRDALRIVPYLHDLGVSDLYASPYLQAREGSMHGYDISDHDSLNPEIGTADDHSGLSRALKAHGMGHLLDIVPNHMGIAGGGNHWWMDVLEHGPSSPFAPFFDIDWYPLHPQLSGKVLLPILGDQFGAVLERGEIQLRFDGHWFDIGYHEHTFPVSPKSVSMVLRDALDELHAPNDDPERLELESIVWALEHLPPRAVTDPKSVFQRRREKDVAARRLATLHERSAPVREALAAAVQALNGDPGDPASYDRLQELLDEQAYRLAFWRVAAEQINYRRFFDVNELAGLRVERPEVFERTHHLILSLLAEGKVTGLRIDHPDGLYDPAEYLRKLQQEGARRTDGDPVYVVVEKILTGDEKLRDDWPVAGTVGYEFMTLLNGLLVASENEEEVTRVYGRFVRRAPDFEELVYSRKKLILRAALSSELSVMAHLLDRLSEQNRRTRDFTLGTITDVLRETIACFPVYRTYIDAHDGKVAGEDAAYVARAIREAKRRNRSTSASAFNFVADILLLRWPEGLTEEERQEHARFVMKFQQLTGPVMAKGVEDTTFYLYNRLVSLNEVGGEPERFGISPGRFHLAMRERAEHWRHALSSTSTHDTKRSEDVRARIHVLSEIPAEWEPRVMRWAEMNEPLKGTEEHGPVPDRNDEYLLYQTLVGAWPLEEMGDEAHARFVERIQRYMEKATREAKLHTSWINPNEEYDQGLKEFIARVLRRGENEFLDDFLPFQRRVARAGMVNALAQLVLKLTCPGVPDVYQGQEVWDFSLVDPDNRRPVDFSARADLLRELRERAASDPRGTARELLDRWEDGSIKMYVTHRGLCLRAERRELFASGDYLPLDVEGERAEHAVAFARRTDTDAVLVVVPRLPATLTAERETGIPTAEDWRATEVTIPAELAGRYRDRLTGVEVTVSADGMGGGDGALRLGEVMGELPVAILERIG